MIILTYSFFDEPGEFGIKILVPKLNFIYVPCFIILIRVTCFAFVLQNSFLYVITLDLGRFFFHNTNLATCTETARISESF